MARKEYGPHKTIYNHFSRWSKMGVWQTIFESVAGPSDPPKQAALDSSHVESPSLRQWWKRGADFQAIRRTKGGYNSKTHAIVDAFCRPFVFILTPGNTADCVMAEECVSLVPSRPMLAKPASPGIKELLADNGYDTDAIRAYLKERGIKPVIPGKSNRKKKIRHAKKAYKNRNVVERCFRRFKDFRPIATRYDKRAQNFFSALCFVATLAYWI